MSFSLLHFSMTHGAKEFFHLNIHFCFFTSCLSYA